MLLFFLLFGFLNSLFSFDKIDFIALLKISSFVGVIAGIIFESFFLWAICGLKNSFEELLSDSFSLVILSSSSSSKDILFTVFE